MVRTHSVDDESRSLGQRLQLRTIELDSQHRWGKSARHPITRSLELETYPARRDPD